MKKKAYTKIVAAALAAIMAFSMAGCGDNDDAKGNNPSGSGSENNQTGQNQPGNDNPGEDTGTHEFSYFGSIWSPYQASTPIFDELMARTGITVNFEWAASDGMDTLLASKVSLARLLFHFQRDARVGYQTEDRIEIFQFADERDFREIGRRPEVVDLHQRRYHENTAPGQPIALPVDAHVGIPGRAEHEPAFVPKLAQRLAGFDDIDLGPVLFHGSPVRRLSNPPA